MARRKALKFLVEAGDARAVPILVDAIERKHRAAETLRQFLAQLSAREAVGALALAWAGNRRPWLGALAVERALATGLADVLPGDRETAWLVVPHLGAGGERGATAEAYVQRVTAAQPQFLEALLFKIGRGNAIKVSCAAVAGALDLTQDQDADVCKGAELFLQAMASPAPAAPAVEPAIEINAPPTAKAVASLVEAVDQAHRAAGAIRHYLAGVTSPDAVNALTGRWVEERQSWLGPIAVERALAIGTVSELPLDRETAWLVAPHSHKGAECAAGAEAYVQRVFQAQPEFLAAFVFKLGRGTALERTRKAMAWVFELLGDPDADVRSGAEAWLKALPNTQQWNDPIVDEWIRTESPFLAKLVAEPRLPSNPAKEALVHLVNRDVAGHRKLEDRDGKLIEEALAMAPPQMRKTINEVVLEAKDGAMADAYRRAVGGGAAAADPQLALRALIASGNEDALFDMARGMTLGEVLPICRHWAET